MKLKLYVDIIFSFLVKKILIFLRNSISLSSVVLCFILPFLAPSLLLPAGYSQDIIVVKTLSLPDGEQILNGFKSICDNNLSIKEYDMKGKLNVGKSVIGKIKKSIRSKNPPKAILTIGGPATMLVQEAITEIPILFCMVTNPKKKGFSGNNIRGITSDVPINVQIDKLKAIVPGVKSIGVIYNPKNTDNIIQEVEQVASEIGLNSILYEVSSQKEVPSAIRNVIKKVDALLIITDSTVVNKNSFEYIITTTLENKIPTISYTDYLVKAGLLASLTPDYFSIGEQAGNVVCKLQENESNTLTSIISPKKLNLAINLKTANRIGLKISPNILDSAKVYK